MGLSLSGAQIRIVTPDGVMTSHCEYPMVETVDVGSPAARAGLSAGDTLVAYNGRDVTQAAVNYAELITAGNTVKVRVRRAGKPREVPVAVEMRREEESAGSARMFVRGVPLSPPAMPPSIPTAMFNPSGVAVLAGAQFATMDAEFAQSLGLEPGVLALRVPAGTPAADAGLRSGDVVRTVNGRAVRDVSELRRALGMSRDAVRLTVQGRGSASRVVVLELR
jgi:serine protease Do